MTRLLWVFLVTGALGGLFLFGLLRGEPDRNIASAQLGETLPEFTLPVHAPFRPEYGGTFEFDPQELQRPLVVNFWATWCIPCRDEAPLLEAAWRRYGERVTILGIQTQERDEDKGRSFISEFGLTFPNTMDADSRVAIDWGLLGVPETFFVRADGTLAYRHIGIVSEAVLTERIEALLQ